MDRLARYQSRMRRDPNRGREARDPIAQRESRTFRQDAGWAMSDAEYADYQQSNTDFNEGYSDADTALKGQEETVAGQRGQLDAGYDALGNLNIEKAWDTFKKDFVPVNVVNHKNGTWNTEATYHYPREVVDQMNATSFNQDEGSYYGAWNPNKDTYSVDVNMRGGGARGQELHQSLIDGQDEVKAMFFESQAPGIAKASSSLSSSLGEAEQTVSANEGAAEGDRMVLEGYASDRSERKDAIADDFSFRRDGRRALMDVSK